MQQNASGPETQWAEKFDRTWSEKSSSMLAAAIELKPDRFRP